MNNEANPALLYPGSRNPEEMAAIYFDGDHNPAEPDREPHELWPDITPTSQDTVVSDNSGTVHL